MRLALTTLLALGLLLTSQAQAEAQVQAQAQAPMPSAFYAFEGITYSKIHGDLAARGTDVLQLQVGLGYQPENSLWAYELMGRGGGTLDGQGASLIGWGLRAKRLIPLSRHFQLYGRAGVTENLLTDSPGSDLVGFGLEYGAGAMASIRVRALGLLFWPAFFLPVGPKVTVSLWADLGGELGNMHSGHGSSAESYDYRTASASYGLNIGGRF
jgi:hypothetical protein